MKDPTVENIAEETQEQNTPEAGTCVQNENCQGDCHCKDKKEKHNKKAKESKLEADIKRLGEEKDALLEKVKLAQAELINYRHRKDEETNNLLKYANQEIISELIVVADNFERAIQLDDNNLTDELSKFLAGFKMMYATLNEILRKYGVEEINRVGEEFDPTQEEALMTDCIEEMEDDIVIEVLLKGYKLKDRVIRPASVKINQK